jgi:hypothetical protein
VFKNSVHFNLSDAKSPAGGGIDSFGTGTRDLNEIRRINKCLNSNSFRIASREELESIRLKIKPSLSRGSATFSGGLSRPILKTNHS